MANIRNFGRLGFLATFFCVALAGRGQNPEPARDWGILFSGTTGPLNAITDVPGVLVGQVTLISGEGHLEKGKGPVRTGVTAIPFGIIKGIHFYDSALHHLE